MKLRLLAFRMQSKHFNFSGWKLGLVFGVIVVCFAMLYPTLFHPMLMGFLGRSPPSSPSINQQRPPIHPAMGGGSGQRHPGGGADVHPAMRMAQAQAESQSGGSKGMFTWMLPVYTIGVVLFLLYTLFKSKGKKSKRKKRNYFDSEDDDDESESETKYGGKFGKKKLEGLQKRLRETESAMSKILEQLESVQAGANPVDLDAADKRSEQLEEDPSVKEAVGLTETNEQYIKDLEVALKEFQSLSKEYDKAKMKKLKRKDSSSDEDEEDEEENSSELSEIEEEEEEVKPVKKSKSSSQSVGKRKNRPKSTSEEEDEGEEESRKVAEDAEEEGIDIDSEIREHAEKEKKDKNVRRRRPKKT